MPKNHDLDSVYDWYQLYTPETAIYKEEDELVYLMLGINCELSEFGNAPNIEAATKEIGDLYWFASQLSHLVGTSLSILRHNNPGVGETGQPWKCPNDPSLTVSVLAQELMDIHGVVAKHIRDGSQYETETKLFLTRLVLSLEAISIVLGVSVLDVLTANLDKLFDRQRREVLGGSGDNR